MTVDLRLTTSEMASFVTQGYVRCDEIVPPDKTDQTRYMFKLRVNTRVKQERLFNYTELSVIELRKVFETRHAFSGNDERTETLNRIRLWRSLTGDASWDCTSWWSRIENEL